MMNSWNVPFVSCTQIPTAPPVPAELTRASTLPPVKTASARPVRSKTGVPASAPVPVPAPPPVLAAAGGDDVDAGCVRMIDHVATRLSDEIEAIAVSVAAILLPPR